MPHLSRRDARGLHTPTPTAVRAAPSPTQQVLHLRCPVCSLLARLDLVEGGPYPSYNRLVRFGGGSVLVWEAPQDLRPGELELLREKIAAAHKLYQAPQEWPARPAPKPPKAPPAEVEMEKPAEKAKTPKAPKPKKPLISEEVKAARGYVRHWEEKVREAPTPAALKYAQEHLKAEQAELARLEGTAPPEPVKKSVKKKAEKVSPERAKPETKPVAETKPRAKETKKAKPETMDLEEAIRVSTTEKPAPAPTPAPFPPFEFQARATRASVNKLIKHLEVLFPHGQEIETPEAKEEFEELREGVQAWVDDVEEMQDTEGNKDNPNDERVEELDIRHEALEKAVSALEEENPDDAIGELREVFPPLQKKPAPPAKKEA